MSAALFLGVHRRQLTRQGGTSSAGIGVGGSGFMPEPLPNNPKAIVSSESPSTHRQTSRIELIVFSILKVDLCVRESLCCKGVGQKRPAGPLKNEQDKVFQFENQSRKIAQCAKSCSG